MGTLVAAPHSFVKDYSFARWAAATSSYDRLLALDEGEQDYAKVVQAHGIRVVFYEPPELDFIGHHLMCSEQFNVAWQTILNAVQGYTHILSLETDVIPPKGVDILAIMEGEKGDEDFLCHGVPWRESYNRKGYLAYEMGCTLASVEAFQKALDADGRLYNTLKSFNVRQIAKTALIHLDEGGNDDAA